MTKTFNIYCDESTHLEYDQKPYMVIGYIKCPYNQLKIHKKGLAEIKMRHRYKGEVKWSKVSKKMLPFFNELVEYFFSCDLVFRAIIIDKLQIDPSREKFTYDDFYFKMYYQLLHNKMDLSDYYNVYIDIKDTCSHYKLKRLNTILEHNSSIRNFQFIKSHESSFLQLSDLLIGAINYYLRGENKMLAKNKLIEKIISNSPYGINKTTPRSFEKVNLFFIDLK